MSAPNPFPVQINPAIVSKVAALTAFRHDMHQHPELGYEERRASDKVVSVMREVLGLGPLVPTGEKSKKDGSPFEYAENSRGSIHRGMGGTGVLVTIHGRRGEGRNIRVHTFWDRQHAL